MLIRKPFAYFSGMIDGLTGHAIIGESGLIEAAYIQKHQQLFRSYTSKRMTMFEKESRPLRQRAEQLLFEYDLFRYELEHFFIPAKSDGSPTVEEIRQANKLDAERLYLNEQIVVVTEELISISNQLQSLKCSTDEDLISLSCRWKAAFASYCKGVFFLKRTAVHETMIPEIEYESSAAYKRPYDNSFNRLLSRMEKIREIMEKEVTENDEEKTA